MAEVTLHPISNSSSQQLLPRISLPTYNLTGNNPDLSKLRRRTSFNNRLDSSDSFPSSHPSVIEAEYFSDDGLHSLPHVGVRPLHPLRLHPPGEGWERPLSNIENTRTGVNNSVSAVKGACNRLFDTTSFLYGSGTQLSTIAERNSKSTLRTVRTLSTTTNTRSSQSLAKYRSSPNLCDIIDLQPLYRTRTERVDGLSHSRSLGRRCKALSDTDLCKIKSSYHDAIRSLGTNIINYNASSDATSLLAHPFTPVKPPLERPRTPPGVPSWTAAQAPLLRLPGVGQTQHLGWALRLAPTRFQRFFGIVPDPVEFSDEVSIPHVPRGIGVEVMETRRAVSCPAYPLHGETVGSRTTAPRFRSISSGHDIRGGIENHPFLTDTNFSPDGVSHQTTSPFTAGTGKDSILRISRRTVEIDNTPNTSETPVVSRERDFRTSIPPLAFGRPQINLIQDQSYNIPQSPHTCHIPPVSSKHPNSVAANAKAGRSHSVHQQSPRVRFTSSVVGGSFESSQASPATVQNVDGLNTDSSTLPKSGQRATQVVSCPHNSKGAAPKIESPAHHNEYHKNNHISSTLLHQLCGSTTINSRSQLHSTDPPSSPYASIGTERRIAEKTQLGEDFCWRCRISAMSVALSKILANCAATICSCCYGAGMSENEQLHEREDLIPRYPGQAERYTDAAQDFGMAEATIKPAVSRAALIKQRKKKMEDLKSIREFARSGGDLGDDWRLVELEGRTVVVV